MADDHLFLLVEFDAELGEAFALLRGGEVDAVGGVDAGDLIRDVGREFGVAGVDVELDQRGGAAGLHLQHLARQVLIGDRARQGLTVVEEAAEDVVQLQVVDDAVEDLLRLQDLELVLDEIRVVVGRALVLEELHLALGLLDADLGGREIPLGHQRGDAGGREHDEPEDEEHQALPQAQQADKVVE